MEEENKISNFQRLLSDESSSSIESSDSCEYYQTEIFGLLPSSQAHRRQQQKIHPDALTHDQNELFQLDRDWNASVPLKALPFCMQDKRDIRERQHLERRNIGSWNSWRRSQQIARRRLKEHVGRAVSGLLPWRHTLHKIEGQFGVGVKAYFVFLRYLLCLNLLYSVIISGSVVTPALVFRDKHDNPGFHKYSFGYKDIFIGSGFLEISPVFHRFYTRGSLDLDCLNTPILFLLGMMSVLILSVFMVVRRTVVGYKHSWLTGNRFSSNASYKVFCGWDFCIQNQQAASLKRNFIRNELKMDLEEQMFNERVQQRSLRQWVQLVFLRVVLNFLVLILLGSSFILIYYAINQSQKPDLWVLPLILEYLPPITMATVNYLLPHVFSKISEFEDYSLTTQLNLTLIRSIFLKLASLGIYLFFLITATPPPFNKCAENEFGKEMYKLTMFNLLQCIFSAFFLAYPRALLVERFPGLRLVQILGKQHFEIPLNVLDLVNSQTVTWVGMFYCPLLPAISTIRLLFVFYIKKFTLVRCCVPAQRIFRTASSSVLFNFMLLLGLFVSVVTLGVNINRFVPGGYGPFEGNRTVFNVTSVCVNTLPDPAQTAIRYISSEAFAFALILAEVVILTSYLSRGRANRKAIDRLKDMLVMCSSDKRFLVKQHSTIMRRQQRTR
ncbi:transmembrane channel-like protein 7 isoform X2 [Myxocyprinus asiaticus]|uniref:transmembrane channel-like protein 7 isoform X2 n=1 Tax=Myxocyprinus asiaticus TaxID=70543 RepID=UPI002221983C|nr:transmembrane channel-like protein 7 isoform X2 [Myxocyprinus asiaticus]